MQVKALQLMILISKQIMYHSSFLTGEGADNSSRQRWPALESNPDVLTNFLIGVGAPAKYSFVDVYGLDDEILGMVPQVFFSNCHQ